MRSRMQIHYPVRQKGKGCSFKRHAGQDVMLGRSGGDNRRNGGLGTAFLVMGRRKWQTDYLPDEEVDFDQLIRKVRIWQSDYLPGHPAGFLSAKKDVRDFNPPLSAKASAGPCRT